MQLALDRALMALREELADEHNGRRILTGDRAKHGSAPKGRQG